MQPAPIRPPVPNPVARAGTWHVDATRSQVEFAVKHVMVATVTGRFTEFEGTLEVDDSGVASAVGTIAAATIETNEPKRDAHLRAADFFDVERYPVIRFVSTAVEHIDGERFRIVGRLTIRNVTRELELEAIVRDAGRDARANGRATLELRGEVSLRAFRIGRKALEASRAVIGDKVKIAAAISVAKAEAARVAA